MHTPYYRYDLSLLRLTADSAARAAHRHGFLVHYAIKANNDPVVAGVLRERGFGADCVSGNEIRRSLELGYSSGSIVFAGVGKTDEEILFALESGIMCFNCESVEELEVIDSLASRAGRIAPVALRVNPSVEAGTHRHITTGTDENKFGISLAQLNDALEYCAGSENIDFIGLHFHIGSQITSLEPYRALCSRVNQIWSEYEIDRYGGKMVNLGGGLGIDYSDPENNRVPDFESFFNVFAEDLRLPEGTGVHFELGRSLVGQCGRLVTQVLYTKKGASKDFVITDAGMTELMRPALYQAVHRIVNTSSTLPERVYDVVGPVCESTDVFGKDIHLPETRRGDILEILSCGAYAESMTLNFNLRGKAGKVYASEGNTIEYSSPESSAESPVMAGIHLSGMQ